MRQPISTNNNDAAAALRGLLAESTMALGFEDRVSVGFTEGRRIAKPAAAVRAFDLTTMTLPPLPSQDGEIMVTASSPGAQSLTLAAGLISMSRVAAAGALVHVAAERPRPQPETDAGLALYSDLAQLRFIKPAEFATVADSALPVLLSSVDWSTVPNVAFRVVVSRRTQKAVGGVDIETQIAHAILMGLARAADKTLLDAIIATTPTSFSLAAAAGRKLAFDDLRALVGTSATGAAVGQDGVLRANGVAAELTDTIGQTVIGSFRHSAVAIRPELLLHVERLSVNGDLKLTCHAALAALVPDPASFWLGA